LGTAAVAAAIAIVSLPLSRIAAVGSGGLGNVVTAARRLRTRADIPAADPAIDTLPGITPRITPNESHYTVDTTLVKPRVLVDDWRLDIKGLVQSPFSLTYDQLLDLEAVEQMHTLECISNYVGGDLISTALWTGVPLRDLLDRAQVRPGAYDVVFTSVDGYTDSIPIAKAMEDRTLVAYLMNGKTVPQDHEKREVDPHDRGRELRLHRLLAAAGLVRQRERQHERADRSPRQKRPLDRRHDPRRRYRVRGSPRNIEGRDFDRRR
jgi:DMSO/TMAO reductase YedYZ molybdopterin-dependent catalytic subunit